MLVDDFLRNLGLSSGTYLGICIVATLMIIGIILYVWLVKSDFFYTKFFMCIFGVLVCLPIAVTTVGLYNIQKDSENLMQSYMPQDWQSYMPQPNWQQYSQPYALPAVQPMQPNWQQYSQPYALPAVQPMQQYAQQYSPPTVQ